MKRLRPIAHDDTLSVVEHLDELRSRLIVCGGVLLVAFCVCFWQNGALINLLNRALPLQSTAAHSGNLAAEPSQSARLHHGLTLVESGSYALAHASGMSAPARQAALLIARGAGEAAKALPSSVSTQVKPITIGVGESFTTTLIVVGYFSLLIGLPVLLYQLYAFVVPALNRNERAVVTPLMVAAPALFVVGAAFAYFFVLPPAVHFLQGYNSDQFDVLVQAKTYYKFEMLLMIGIGAAFQVPLVLLGLQRLGVLTPQDAHASHWRYAVVLIAIVAAALPGVDPVTMALEILPLIVLYLASIVMLKIVDRRDAKRAATGVRPRGPAARYQLASRQSVASTHALRSPQPRTATHRPDHLLVPRPDHGRRPAARRRRCGQRVRRAAQRLHEQRLRRVAEHRDHPAADRRAEGRQGEPAERRRLGIARAGAVHGRRRG